MAGVILFFPFYLKYAIVTDFAACHSPETEPGSDLFAITVCFYYDCQQLSTYKS